tara:strand:- start:346 stop:645 length:300 start_codon:yes stop_codon:yes gene_type:complete
MGSLGRKLRRKQEKEKEKAAQRAAKGVQDAVEAMPNACGECGIKFDKKDKAKVNSWTLAVYDDGRIHLACPECGPTEEERASATARRATNSKLNATKEK